MPDYPDYFQNDKAKINNHLYSSEQKCLYTTGWTKKNATLVIGWGYYSKKICNNPNFDTLSLFLELDLIIFNQKLF